MLILCAWRSAFSEANAGALATAGVAIPKTAAKARSRACMAMLSVSGVNSTSA